jgi:tRNA dimethylallyltransferase
VKPVIIILGPTGVGKTGLSILLAKALKTEIISADSMLVYRHMDIGTAKPSPEELAEVPHHLINILEPREKFSAGLFKEKASEIIRVLHNKNKIPLIVGGTGLYIRSLTSGLFEGPGADEALREELKKQERRHGTGYLYNKLKSLDPEAAGKIEPNDVRRIVRALEVSLKAEKGISEIQRGSTQPLDCSFIKIGLSRDRKELYRIIEDRVDKMVEGGLPDETRRLLKMKPGRTAMQALGYKEMALFLDGSVDLSEAVRLTKKRTKMYAKRQYTWFRKEPELHWIDITGIMETEKIFEKAVNEVEILKKLIYSKVC